MLGRIVKPKFFSQNGEDYILWRFFEGKNKGFYVDIGAFDGIHLSNTYAFEQMGWQGICVEPNPEMFTRCLKNRPQALCINHLCVGKKIPWKKKFYLEDTGLLCSTIKNHRKTIDIKQRYKARGLLFSGFKKIKLKAETFNQIMDNCLGKAKRQIDFVSIDTEGTEFSILKGMDFIQNNIRVLVIEFNRRIEKKMTRFLAEKGGYKLARQTLHNSFYARTQSDLKRINSIPLNCVIEKQDHPKGLLYTTQAFRKNRIIKE